MKVFISGGSGFVGGNLSDYFYEKGHQVIITGNDTENDVKHHKILHCGLKGINWKSIDKIDVLFHQAANNNTLDQDREEMFFDNLESSIFLFEKALKLGCRKFIWASSTAIYGDSPAPYFEDTTLPNPLNLYAESKLKLEKFAIEFAKDKNVSAIGLRYCNVYGLGEKHKKKRSSMIHQLAIQMKKGKNPKIFKDGEQKRDWIFIKDVIAANVLASQWDGIGIFNCGSGKATSFNEIIEILKKEMNIDLNTEYIDNPFPKSYQNYTECNMSKAEKELKFIPQYSVKKGIKEMLRLYF